MLKALWLMLFSSATNKRNCENGFHEFGRWDNGWHVQARHCVHCNLVDFRYPVQGRMKQ